MGRLFETLKQAASVRSNVVEGSTVREDCVVDWSLREAEEVPFIEVGDGKKIEGSPQVMAVKHPAVSPPHLVAVKNFAPAPTAAVRLTEPKPLAVSFEVWPGVASGTALAPEIIAFHQPSHPISQQYDILFRKILESVAPGATQALLVCGARPHVGASTVILNLGVVGVERGKRRLVLVDGQRTRPSLADRLGLTASAGLYDALAGNVGLEQAVVKTAVAGLHLLPARSTAETVPPPAKEALAWLLGWLKPRFDLVLVDAPAWEETPDAALFASLCDGVFLVVPREEPVAVHKPLTQIIARQGGRLRGLIHTHLEM
ncbi:MAG: hypothetical protein HY040_19620 [Planctomycetes bacterium]|nr:hypothetical protein [Planctomycetota bacterium]